MPTPVECGSTRRPTSVNIRIECLEGTCATYTISSPSSSAMFAVSPVSSTSRARWGLAQVPSSRDADSPSRMSRGPSAYRRFGCCRTYPQATRVRIRRWMVGRGSPLLADSSLRPTSPPASAIRSSRSKARSRDWTPPPEAEDLAGVASAGASLALGVGTEGSFHG